MKIVDITFLTLAGSAIAYLFFLIYNEFVLEKNTDTNNARIIENLLNEINNKNKVIDRLRGDLDHIRDLESTTKEYFRKTADIEEFSQYIRSSESKYRTYNETYLKGLIIENSKSYKEYKETLEFILTPNKD